MKHKKSWLFLVILCSILFIYSVLYNKGILPIEKRSIPYAATHSDSTKRYAYYTIFEEDSSTELMRIPLLVQIGDEILSADNNLYEVIRVEEDRAYARFLRKVKL